MLIIATNSAFIVTLIIFGNITVHQVVLRSVSVFMFFMFIFVAIFVPRRWLRNNRKYRYFLLSLYRRYPEVFYIRAIIGGGTTNISFILFDYTGYYIRRLIHLLFIGTTHKEIWPYRKHRTIGILILIIYLNFAGFFEYVYGSVVKILYDVIYTYDTKSIKDIAKSRVMGYMMVMSLFYVLGEHGFKIYIGLILIIVFMRHGINIIYFFVARLKATYDKGIEMDYMQILMDASMLHGYNIDLQYILVNLQEKVAKTRIFGSGVIFYLGKRIRGKYSKCLLPITLTTSRQYNTRLRRYCIINGGDKSGKHSDALYSEEDIKFNYRRVQRNTSSIRWIYITKSMETFFKKQRYMQYEVQHTDEIGRETILEYYPTLTDMVEYARVLFANEHLFGHLVDTKASRYLLLTRKMELTHKCSLIQYVYSPAFESDEEYDFYVRETMRDFWSEFIELKQFSRITKKFIEIVEQEGGRQEVAKRIKQALGPDTSSWHNKQGIPYIFGIIKQGEEKYNW